MLSTNGVQTLCSSSNSIASILGMLVTISAEV